MSSKLLQLIIQLKDEASSGLNSLRGSLEGVGGLAGGALIGGFVAATAAVGALGATSLSVASDFQSATATFASVAGGSLQAAGFSLDDVKNKALDMGAQTQFSAAQAQEAMISLAKGGVPIKDIMGEATQATLDLAAAGELELGTAADIVSKQLGVWADTGVKAADVSNLMAQAANASTVDVDELALGLANVGGVAKASGVSFQDLTQTMAMIAPGFSSAADAGTSLKTMILALQPTTGGAIDAFQKFGLMQFNTVKAMEALRAEGIEPVSDSANDLVTQIAQLGQSYGLSGEKLGDFVNSFETSKFYDLQGNFVGMDKAAQLLQSSLGGLSEAEQSAALKAMFGTDAFRAASIVVNQGQAGFRAMGDAMDAAGTAAEQAAIRNATFKFAWDSLLGTIETIQIVIGSALLPVLTDLVNNAIIPATNGVLDFVQSITSSSDPIGTLIASINSVIPGFSTFAAFVSGNLVPLLGGLGAIILALVVPPFYAWATAAATSAITTMIAMAPITLTLLAIGAAVALLVAAWQNNWGGIQQIVAAAWATIQPYLQQLWQWLQVAIPAAIAVLVAFWSGTLLPALQAAGAFITGTVIPALAAVVQWLATNIPVAIAAAAATWAVISTAVSSFVASVIAGFNVVATTIANVWNAIQVGAAAAWAYVTTSISSAVTTITTIINVIVTIVTAAWNTISFLNQAVWGGIASVIGPPLSAAAAFVSSAVATIVSAVSSAWAAVQSVTSAAWGAVVGYIGPQISAAQSIVSSVSSAIVGVLSSAWASIVSVTTSTWSAIVGFITGPLSQAQSVVSTIVSTIQSVWTASTSAVQTQTSSVFSQVQSIITSVMDAIRIAISTAVEIVKTIITGAWQVIVAASENDFGRIPEIISGVWDKVKDTFNQGVEALRGVASNIAAAAVNIGNSIIDGIKSGISAGVGALTDAVKNAAKKALDAAKSLLGIHSPSAVMAAEVGVPLIEGIALGVQQASPKAIGAVLDVASKLVDVVQKGVDAFGKLSQLGSIPQGAIDNFANGIKTALETFGATAQTWNTQAYGWARQFLDKAGSIVDVVGKGVDALSKLQTFGPIPEASIAAFARAMLVAIASLTGVAQQISSSALVGAAGFADAAGKIIAIIGNAVDALQKISGFVAPTNMAMFAFANGIGLAVAHIERVARWFIGAPMAAATLFAESAGKMIGVIGNAVDAFAKLDEFVAPTNMRLFNFTNAIGMVVAHFARVANWFQGASLTPATQFTDAASKMIGIIGSGAEAFAKLDEFVAPSNAAIVAFSNAIRLLVAQIVTASRMFAAQSLTAAASFADSAGKVVAVIGPAVDGFAKLPDIVAPTYAQTKTFSDGLLQVVSQLWAAAHILSEDALTATASFADSAGKAISILGSGVDGFAKLADLGPVSAQSIDAFAAAINQTMQRLGAAASQFSADAIEHAGQFADAAGKSVGILKTGVEGLLYVDTFAGVSQDAIDRFGDGVRMAVASMATLATEFGADATAAAKNFAEAAGESTDFLKKGVDGFGKLSEFTSVPQQSLDEFAAAIVSWVNTIIKLSGVLSSDVLLQANTFAKSIDSVITIIRGGLDAIKQLGEQTGDISVFTQNLIAGVERIAAAVSQQVAPASHAIGANIVLGIAAGITSQAGAIQNAVYAAINQALAAARAALGIASPSKVFDQIGQMSGQGLAGGMNAQQANVSAAASQLANAAIAPVVAVPATTAAVAPRVAPAASSSSSSLTIEKGAITIIQQRGESDDALAQRLIAMIEKKYKDKL